MKKPKQLLFSVTAKDCQFSFCRPTGKGGQKMQKTDSAAHCKHLASSAHGFCQDHREQYKNKQIAFQRMTETKEFKSWLKMEVARKSGQLSDIEENVERLMQDRFIRVETKDEEGLWKPEESGGEL